MKCYDFLYTADSTYFPHMLTSIYSLIENHLEYNVTIHIIEANFEKEQYLKLENLQLIYPNVNIKVYSIDKISKLLEQFKIPKWRGTDVANARLFAFEVVQDVDRLLYIDSDTIVNQPLTDVFHGNSDAPVSAVKEFEIPLHIKDYLNQYYNSGVLLFDYNCWEGIDCLRLLFNKMEMNQLPIIYPDQDLLNLALSEMISPLPVDYNLMPIVQDIMSHPFLAKKKFDKCSNFYSYEEVAEALIHPHIFHMLANLYGRPWQKDTINPFTPYYDKYRNLWNPNFDKEPNHQLMSKLKIMSYLNVILTTCLPSETCQSIKNKVKEIIYK